MTNAHVVEGAQRIRVVLPTPAAVSPLEIQPLGKAEILEAQLVGLHKETDLALLKVEGHNFPTLPLQTNRAVHPGELVLGIGNPEGLQNSVTMGVVSAVWRQPDPDQPMVYIQTDDPINRRNSGDPLVDPDGYIVGLNTFILSESGGSEGLGVRHTGAGYPVCVPEFAELRARAPNGNPGQRTNGYSHPGSRPRP